LGVRRTRIALLVAEKESVQVELIETTGDNKSEDFKSKFPMQKVTSSCCSKTGGSRSKKFPALEHGDVKLFETIAVAYVSLQSAFSLT
jgi:glutathione S-transferase